MRKLKKRQKKELRKLKKKHRRQKRKLREKLQYSSGCGYSAPEIDRRDEKINEAVEDWVYW